MDVVLLHHEKAGERSWSRRELIRLVRHVGLRPKYLSRDEALNQPDLLEKGEWVIVAGGDGSVRKIALRLLGKKIPIAILPLGTANNIARSLGLPTNPEEIVASWKHARLATFDAGVATGPFGRMPFLEGVGFGLISCAMGILEEIDRVSAHRMKRISDRLYRDACVCAALAHEMSPLPVGLVLDGHDSSDDFLLLEVLNIRRSGPALSLAPRARHDDGWFDVVTVTGAQRAKLVKNLEHRLSDAAASPWLPARRARRLTLVSPQCDMRIDDRMLPLNRGDAVELVIDRHALTFVLPGKR